MRGSVIELTVGRFAYLEERCTSMKNTLAEQAAFYLSSSELLSHCVYIMFLRCHVTITERGINIDKNVQPFAML